MKHPGLRFYIVVLIILHAFVLSNLQFTAWPEMFSYPFLRNHKYLLYVDMVHPYPPILTLALSVWYSIWGYTVTAMQGFVWILLAINDVFIYLILSGITKNRYLAILGMASYIALQPFLEGNMLWFDIAITTPILLGTIFALKPKPNVRIFIAALCFTTAALMKQTGALFYFGYLAWLLIQKVRPRDMVIALLTPFILIIPLFVRLLDEGAMQGFLNWVIIYPSTFWTKFPGYVRMNLTGNQLLVMSFLFLPLTFLIIYRKKLLEEVYLMLLFLIIGLISIYPRFSYFHLQTALPFFAILYPIAIHKLRLKKATVFWVIGLVFAMWFIQRPVMNRDWGREVRFASSSEYALAKQIEEKTQTSEPTFLLGLHSGLYVYADRLPVKPWVDNFGWYYEVAGVQEWVLGRWKENPPKEIFWQMPASGPWYEIGAYQPQKIKDWILAKYSPAGMIGEDIVHWRLR